MGTLAIGGLIAALPTCASEVAMAVVA